MTGKLYIRVRTPYEAECAEKGGADRLVLMTGDNLSPTPEVVDKVRKASTVELRVVLRLREDFGTDGGEMTRLIGLASAARQAGADGFVLGFLNGLSGIDVDACSTLIGDDTWPWTFDRAIDAALDQDRAWQDLAGLPRLDSVMTAGSAREVEQGIDRLIALANAPVPVVAAGGLLPEHVPWLVRGGITHFFVDQSPVEADQVRAWRRLIDLESARLAARSGHVAEELDAS